MLKQKNTPVNRLTEIIAIALGYFALARVGQVLAIDPGNVTPVWPASGFALAVVLWRGYHVWPGLWLGNFLGNTWAFFDPSTFGDALRTLATGLAIGPGDVLQACLGAYLIRRWCQDSELFDRTRDIFTFTGAQAIACLSSATFGVLAMCIGGVASWEAFGYTWLTWYLGDGVGVLLIAPLLLALRLRPLLLQFSKRSIEPLAILILSALVSALVFNSTMEPSLGFVPIPLVLWAAIRGDQFQVSMTVLVIAAMSIWGTYLGGGPFITERTNVSLLTLQLYAAIMVVTGTAVASALGERRRAESALQESEDRLRAILENAVDAIITIDRKAMILTVNPATEDIFGYNKDELLGENVKILLPPPYHDGHDDYLQRYHESGQQHVIGLGREVIARRKDGSTFPISLRIVELPALGISTGILREITHEKQLQQALLDASELEKTLVGYDIHDTICQEFTGLSLLCSALRQRLNASDSETASIATQLNDQLKQTTKTARQLASGLSPIELNNQTLEGALQQLIEHEQAAHPNVEIALELRDPVDSLDSKRASHCYQIIREALTNSLKHAEAQRIKVQMWQDVDDIIFSVTDDGQGDPQQFNESGRLGIRSIRHRVSILGGDLKIRKNDRTGVQVWGRVPITSIHHPH